MTHFTTEKTSIPSLETPDSLLIKYLSDLVIETHQHIEKLVELEPESDRSLEDEISEANDRAKILVESITHFVKN